MMVITIIENHKEQKKCGVQSADHPKNVVQ